MIGASGTRILRWESWDGSGVEHCEIRADGLDFIAEGLIVSPKDEGFAARYVIRFDAAWKVEAVSATIAGHDLNLSITADEDGLWHRDGQPLPELRYAMAPDLSATPLTNTFAIRRLHLGKGKSADIETAYIAFPELALSADPQRYTCIESDRLYRFESLDSDFKADITVDRDGFVTDYPGLFRRVL